MRQTDEDDRRAVADLRAGKGTAAMSNYSARERLHIAADSGAALDRMVEDCCRLGGLTNPKDHVIFAQTRAEVRAANDGSAKARSTRDYRGKGAVLVGSDAFMVGDRVLFHSQLMNLQSRTLSRSGGSTNRLLRNHHDPPRQSDTSHATRKKRFAREHWSRFRAAFGQGRVVERIRHVPFTKRNR